MGQSPSGLLPGWSDEDREYTNTSSATTQTQWRPTLPPPSTPAAASTPSCATPCRGCSRPTTTGSTPSGSEDPSWPPSPPSSRCGSPSRSTTSAAPPSSTASASKLLLL